MEQFIGFPNGKMRFVSIPDLLFAQLLPQIDSFVELKVTLHFLWLHTRHARHVVPLEELLSDETLLQSVSAVAEEDPVQAINEGLYQAVARTTLLCSQVREAAETRYYFFLNSERGRMAQQKFEAGKVETPHVRHVTPPPPPERANIFKLYEDNIGLLSPIVTEWLKEAEETYPYAWIEEAFQIAIANNVRRWSYIRAILEKMSHSGRNSTQKEGETWYTTEDLQWIRQ